MLSLVGLSIFECEQPVCVLYKVWAKRSFLFKNGTNRPGGTVSCGGSTPWSGSERHHWLTWESQTVCECGVYHWKSMKVQGVKSWIAPYFVVRGHRVSLQSPLSLGKSHSVSGLKMKVRNWWPFLLQASVRTQPGCFLVNPTCISLSFHSKKRLKTKMIIGSWVETKCT